jgi:hypothetical protein
MDTMANGRKSRLGVLWRKLIILAAGRVQLNSPFMCVFFASVFVITIIASRNLWVSFEQVVLLRSFHGLAEKMYYANRVVQCLCGLVAFTFFARMLQICYPKYYEHQYDRHS